MKIGFTGTQNGMTPMQMLKFAELIHQLKPTEFHHGCCQGADLQAHDIITKMGGTNIIKHPPLNTSKQATCNGGVSLPPKDYLIRNHDIVNATDVLIATPKEIKMVLRSGTWSTVRYCIKSNKVVYIIYPTGIIKES